jgi:septal ring factor EnvC (AmiA/AmiB activator)
MYFAVGIVAAFVAVLVISFRRNRLLPLNGRPPLLDHNKERIEKLSFMVDELKTEKHQLSAYNADLQDQVRSLNSNLDELKQTRSVLEKSNVSLSKSSEKLKAEKEALVLMTSAPLVRPKKAVPVPAKKKKDARKPKRVSRKAR